MYLVSFPKPMALNPSTPPVQKLLSSFKILENNENNQASLDELKSYLQKGFITAIGDGLQKKRKHLHYTKNGQSHVDHYETFTMDYISKNFNGTIQNNNLPSGNIWETWLPGTLGFVCETNEKGSKTCSPTNSQSWRVRKGVNGGVFQWPDLFHWQVNGYANSWWFDLDILQKLPPATEESAGFYQINPDGSIDFEVIIEFWPQRLLYVGLAIS
ncbi:MAG: hypothetical protein ACE5EK_07710, partial [Nitrospinales bacterium]